MISQLLLLSTCGTSVLTNHNPSEIGEWLKTITNARQLSDSDRNRLNNHIAKRRQYLATLSADGKRTLSAELSAISAVLDRWPATHVQHLLIHTDTAVGLASAEVLKTLLESDGQQVQLLTAGGLQTDDFPSFREALAELTKVIEEWVAARNKTSMTIFNLTGGFKSVSAYLQALGMLHADRCVFLFEGAQALMEIPRLPVRLAEIDELRPYAVLFRRLDQGYYVRSHETNEALEALLLISGDEVTTNVWGDVVWGRIRKTLLAESLQNPLSPKLALKDSIRSTFNGLPPDRRVQVNEALDALSAYLDGIGSPLKSNTFKKLKGNRVPPSTHEMYLWSDGEAWRLFGHYEGPVFIVDWIGAHL